MKFKRKPTSVEVKKLGIYIRIGCNLWERMPILLSSARLGISKKWRNICDPSFGIEPYRASSKSHENWCYRTYSMAMALLVLTRRKSAGPYQRWDA